MRLSNFDYQLPKELIAQAPLVLRDQSRLLVLERNSGKLFHQKFSDLVKYLSPSDCLILNNTKVVPARIFGKRKTGAKVEILLLEKKNRSTYRCLLKPARVKLDEPIVFNNNSLSAKILVRRDSGHLIRFEGKSNIDLAIKKLGIMPLPPYIRRNATDFDRITYQTVYAEEEGAIAAPTAGLHFTKKLLSQIKEKGTQIGFLTLHVGWGTFRPIKTDEVISHKMEEEKFSLPQKSADLINSTKKKNNKVFAVGTTTTRVLETIADDKGEVTAAKGKTDLFIYPGYRFKVVDCLLTNFHLPKSTLFLLVCAFAGRDLIFKAYQEAIKERYRFYSYGDAMLIL